MLHTKNSRANGVILGWSFFFLFGMNGLAWGELPFRIVAKWSVQGTKAPGAWSPDGTQVVYTEKTAKQVHLKIYTLATKASKTLVSGGNIFFPTFGPSGTVFSGPQMLPQPKKEAKPRVQKALKKARLQYKSSKQNAPQRRLVPKPRNQGEKLAKGGKKLALSKRGTTGAKQPVLRKDVMERWKKYRVMMWGFGQRSLLFPGWKPKYSQKARRLLFEFKNVLYLWNPMKTKQEGLMLLTRGAQADWSPDGRAIAFTRVDEKTQKRGGIRVVDMLFRAAQISRSGSQPAWLGDGRSLVFVDLKQKEKRPGLYWLPLKKGKKPVRLAKDADSPVCSKDSNPQRGWIAFHNVQGVWVYSLSKKKAWLVVPQGRFARWSSQGSLLVRTATHFLILRP